jgi:hypothetical protein
MLRGRPRARRTLAQPQAASALAPARGRDQPPVMAGPYPRRRPCAQRRGELDAEGRMRDIEAIDAELRLLAAVRR